MALPVYDESKHHIGLGGDAGSLKGFFIRGYNKQRQRETDKIVQEFGGGRDDLGSPGASRWNQESFIGGAFQYRVDPKDLARFSDSTNLLPMLQGEGAISVPPMILAHAFDPLGAAYTSHINGSVTVPTYVEPKRILSVAGSTYIAFKHGIFRYQPNSDTLTFSNVNAPDLGTFNDLVDIGYDANEEIYWAISSADSPATRPLLRRFRHDFTDPNVGTEVFQGPSKTEGFKAYGLDVWGADGAIVVSLGMRLWSFLPPDPIGDVATAGTWKMIGRLPGRWKASLPFNNRLYILCNEADGQTHLVTWDGISILPVCTFSFEFEGQDLVDYGGRLFVVGRGTDVNGGDRYGELHEVTGASNRLVRTFQPEHYADYPGVGTPKNFKTVAVMDGLLWMSHQGRRLVSYDLTADAFWGASEFQGLVGTNFTVHALCRCRGGLYGYGSTNGVNTETGMYRVALNTDVPAAYSSVLETSDFDVRPARKKRWSQLLVRTRNQTLAPTFQYSLDSGTTWTALAVTTVSDADVQDHTADLTAVPTSTRIRFRLTFPRGTDTSFEVLEILSMSTSFIFLDTGKWAWGLTIISADKIETFDDDASWTEETFNVDEVAEQLESWSESSTALVFKDLDLGERKVQVIDLRQSKPTISPRHNGNTEGYFSLTLQEV